MDNGDGVPEPYNLQHRDPNLIIRQVRISVVLEGLIIGLDGKKFIFVSLYSYNNKKKLIIIMFYIIYCYYV